MTNRSTTARSTRRTEPQPPESDIAAIFERRLLARAIRTDDFLDWRNSTELPTIPALTPLQFGRGAGEQSIAPMFVDEPEPSDPDPSPPDEPTESSSN